MKSWWHNLAPPRSASGASPPGERHQRPGEAGSVVAPEGTAHHAEQVLRRLEWKVIRRLDGLLQGDYRTLLRGAGLDLADLREYQLHDDVRHIDWNVTARLTVPHVREFLEERDLTAWFLLDLSPSIDFGSQRRKREVSEAFVGLMASLVLRHGNRAGAVLYGNAVDTVLPARSGRMHVLHLMQRMRARPSAAAAGTTRLADLIERARPSIKRRSAVFVISVALTGCARRMALRVGMIDLVNERSSHATPRPRGGGAVRCAGARSRYRRDE